MNTGLVVAIVSAAASVIVAAVSLVFNARQSRAQELRELKLARYTELLTTISDLAVHGLTADTQAKYSSACNTISLTASPAVIRALYEYEEELNIHNPRRTLERQRELFSKLVRELRRSLELPFEEEPDFQFLLMGGLEIEGTPSSSPSPDLEKHL